MDIQDSKGLIPVAEFAEQKGMEIDKVIRMIKDGFYSGKLFEGQWYVDGSESTDLSRDQIKPPKRYGKIIVTVMYVLGWIGVALGSILYVWSLWSWIIEGDLSAAVDTIYSMNLIVSSLLTIILALLMRAVFDIANNSTDLLGLLRQREATLKGQRPTPNAQRPTPNAQRPTPDGVADA